MEFWEPSGEVLAHCWKGKKSKIGRTEEGNKDSFTSTLAQGSRAQDQERTLQPMISPVGGGESVWAVSPAVWDPAKENHFFLAPSRILRYATQMRGGEGPGEQHPGFSESTKGMQSLLTASQTPLRTLLMSWGGLTYGSASPRQMAQGHCKQPSASSTHHATLWLAYSAHPHKGTDSDPSQTGSQPYSPGLGVSTQD